MSLFERTKKAADARKLSLKLVASKAGLAENAIYRWDTSNPKSENLNKVAEVLGVSTDYLLGNTDEMTPNKKDSNVSTEVDLEKDPVMLSLDGMELTEDYREFIIDQIRSLRKMRGDK